jgi:leucyl-tRNA synthetase
VAVQIDGKVRDKVEVPTEASQDAVLAEAMKSERVTRSLEGRAIAKVIYVPGRLLSLVTAR